MSNPHREDFTIVIQGPANKVSIEKIPIYNSFGKVIVSHWDSDLVSLGGIDCEEVVSDFTYWSTQAKEFNNRANFLYQTVTTLEGIKNVKTPYCIKVRSDEYYTDLSVVTNYLKSHPKMIVTNNVFCYKEYFHISDHLIAGKTSILLKTFTELLSIMASTSNRKDFLSPSDLNLAKAIKWCMPNTKYFYPEQCIGIILYNLIERDSIMNAFFDKIFKIVGLKDLGDVCVHSHNLGDIYCYSEKDCEEKFGLKWIPLY